MQNSKLKTCITDCTGFARIFGRRSVPEFSECDANDIGDDENYS